MSDQERLRVISVLVEDGSNTLSKVSGLIRRRGFHVRSISVGPSREAGRSRMTLTVDAGHAEVDQVRKQLERVVEVIEVEDVTSDDVHSRELVVAKVKAAQVARLVERGARVLNTSADSTTVEFAGEGKDVGEITSVATLPGGSVALGYIRREAAAKELTAGTATVKVASLPFQR